MQSCLALIPDDLQRIYLAYSGGLDSSVLLHLLVTRFLRIFPCEIPFLFENNGLRDLRADL